MSEHYLVVSDLHLADVEDHADGWKYFKGSRYLFDEDFAALVSEFSSRCPDCSTLLLNGDILDFDLVTALPEDPPYRVGRVERRGGLRATPTRSLWKLDRILAQHPVFVDALGAFLAAGNRIVWVLGNHDREICLPEVEAALQDAIFSASRREGSDPAEGSLVFEPWFHYVRGRIYAEHGHQYDYYNTYRYLLDPLIERREETEIGLPMGNLSNRILMGRMGYFNPHTGDYIMDGFRYVAHWLRFYALSRRNLLMDWLTGSLLAFWALLDNRSRLRPSPEGYVDKMEAMRRRAGLSPDELAGLRRLQRAPVTDQVFRVLREYWIDRLVLISVLALIAVGMAVAVSIPLWVKLVVPLTCFPLIYFVYEALVAGETVSSSSDKLVEKARAVGKVLRVPVVTFGHTHNPHVRAVGPGITYVDTGTWAPITETWPLGELLPGYRNWLEIDFHKDPPRLHFDCMLGPSSTGTET